MASVTPASTDEIYEKYLKKAIVEINELGDEIARAAKGEWVPVLGSGHPRADIFLIKHRPQSAEVQEGLPEAEASPEAAEAPEVDAAEVEDAADEPDATDEPEDDGSDG